MPPTDPIRRGIRAASIVATIALLAVAGLVVAPSAQAGQPDGWLDGGLVLAGGATTVSSPTISWSAWITGDPQPASATYQVGPADGPLASPAAWGADGTASGTLTLPGPGSYLVLLRYCAADGRMRDLFASIVVAGGLPTPSPGPEQPLPPSTGGPGGPADPAALRQSYRLEVALDFDAGRLDTLETITITNASTTSIGSLDLSVIPEAMGYYTPDGDVTVDGAVALTAWTTGTNLRVTLPASLEPRGTLELRVPFHLRVTEHMGVGRSSLMRSLGVLALGEWFPILSREHDAYGIGDQQVSWNADEIVLDLTSDRALPRDAVACQGEIVTAPEVSGTHWVCRSVDARDYALAVSPHFRRTTTHVGSVTVRTYAVSGEGARAAVLAGGAIRAYTRLYGPYPYPSLTIAEAGPRLWANEFPALVFVGTAVIDDAYVMYHEIAHQWFYAALGNDQQADPIVDEGLAELSANTVLGRGYAYCSSLRVDQPVDRWPAGHLIGEWMGCGGYFETIYHKGAAFYDAMRDRMGATAFYATLRSLLTSERFGLITHDELFAAFEARTPGTRTVLGRFTNH